MESDIVRLHELLNEGKCCASALVQMALELKGEENDQLVQAVGGLCGGVRGKLICGALTGAACMLNILGPQNANSEMIPELVEWFRSVCKEEYGGIDCADIIGDMPGNRVRCPRIIEETYLQAKTILSDYGYDFDY